MRVLLVEDDEVLAETVAILLRDDGVLVDVEHDGRRVIGAIAHRKPDVVVLDVSLKDMDGTVVASALRACWPEMPIIFATGNVQSEDIGRAWRDQKTVVLEKPFKIEALMHTIDAVTRSK